MCICYSNICLQYCVQLGRLAMGQATKAELLHVSLFFLLSYYIFKQLLDLLSDLPFVIMSLISSDLHSSFISS